MASIRLGTNISSLLVQRNLATVTFALQTNFERLSSGLRINSAKDDAAGLSISETLNADARIYTQAVRNVNDGISLLNVAEAALTELSNIVTRQIELAEQASNDTNSQAQRAAIQQELDALTEEHNRILSSTEFNNISLLSSGNTALTIQAGRSSLDSIGLTLGEDLARTVGDGTFEPAVSLSFANDITTVDFGDYNGDGILDMAASGPHAIMVRLGNGDGTFDATLSFATGLWPNDLRSADLNGDGILDLVSNLQNADGVSVLLGNGDGTFGAYSFFKTGEHPQSIRIYDINNDGVNDILTGEHDGGTMSVLLGNGDGSFNAFQSFAAPGLYNDLGDVNGDGILDIVSAGNPEFELAVLISNGDGTFKAPDVIKSGDYFGGVALGDFNRDGILDISYLEVDGVEQIHIIYGKGDGSFDTGEAYDVSQVDGGGNRWLQAADMNGDGLLDLMVVGRYSDDVSLLLGKADGTFSEHVTFAVGNEPYTFRIADINGDGVLDLASADHTGDTISILLAETTEVTSQAYVSVRTSEEALLSLDALKTDLSRITAELGVVGASQSRFTHTVNNLQQMRENYLTASSQITDADVAEEAANLVRNQILQQAAAAVLAQANQQSGIALLLLG